jgi:hypothetical protein
MSKDEPYRLKKPCAKCPFRTDIRPFLRPDRVDEIEAALEGGEFPCHETVDYESCPEDEEGGVDVEARDPQGEAHCAGALILLEKLNRPSQMMRISERLGMYDRRKLDMAAPVFDSFEEMREAMEREHGPKKVRRRRAR